MRNAKFLKHSAFKQRYTMNENNKGNKNEKKSGLKTAILWIVVILIFSMDIFGESMLTFLGVIFAIGIPIVAVFFIFGVVLKKNNGAANENKRSYAPKREYTAPDRQYYDSDCMEADTGHDHDRRAEQLESFYKNGLIDKEEYELMAERYERAGYGR